MRTLERTRADLAALLRAHREHLLPADVGLPNGGRRRTPGRAARGSRDVCTLSGRIFKRA